MAWSADEGSLANPSKRIVSTEPEAIQQWLIAITLGLELDGGLRGLSALYALAALGAAGGLVAVEPR